MSQIPEQILRHIHTIAEQEENFRQNQTVSQRLGNLVGGFVGSFPFVVFHLAWFVAWLLINTLPGLPVRPFDPFPFALLGIIIEIEGIFLASFILIRQNRMNRRSSEREHLILQVLLLTEQEVTTLIDIEKKKSISRGHDEIAKDPNVAILSQPTSVDDLTKGLQEHLPDE